MSLPLAYVTANEMRTVWITQLSTSDEPAMESICNAASRYVETMTNRRFWTTTGDETKSFDVAKRSGIYASGGYYGYETFDPGIDLASVTTLNLAESSVKATSGTYASISTGDYYLRPADRPDGWPATYIALTDEYSGTYNSSAPFMWFMPGRGTVQIVGRFGWNTTSVGSTVFPQEIRVVTAEIAAWLWRTRQAGFNSQVTISDLGAVQVPRTLSPYAREVLERYTRPTSR